MLSIVIPVFNVYGYIDRCLKSVLEQKNGSFEIILINDGSTDGSDEKCIEWEKKDRRIRYISQKNNGLGPVRNLGVKLARYDYVTFLDSDDWWEPDYVEEMLCAIRRYSADIAACDIFYVWIDGFGQEAHEISRLRLEANSILNASANPELIIRLRTFAWGKVYRKEFLLESGIQQPAHAFEDIPFTPVIAALAGRVCRVGKPLYNYYRNRAGSLANDPQKYRDMPLSLYELKHNFEQKGLFLNFYNEIKKLAFSQVRFILRKCRLGDTALKLELLTFMKHSFPDWKDIPGMQFGIIGGAWLKTVVQNIVIDDSQIIFHKHISDFKPEMILGDNSVIIDGMSLPRALRIISADGIKTINLKEISSNEPDENDCWNVSDKLMQML